MPLLPGGAVDEDFDLDGDGVTTCGGDCDDTDVSVNPSGTEACNAADDDCDGLVDEGFDTDSDGWSTCEGDCDDTNATVYPGATELLDDGVDQDCDGSDSTTSGDDDDAANDDDSGANDDDAANDDDSGASVGLGPPDPPQTEDGAIFGCACSTASRSSGSWTWLVLVALGWTLRRRRCSVGARVLGGP